MSAANIAFWGALSFLAGVFIAGSDFAVLLPVLLFTTIILIFAAVGKCEWRTAFFLIFIFIFGIFYYNFFFNLKELSQKIVFNKNISFSGVVSAEPQLSERYQRLTLELFPPFAGEISVLVSLSPEIKYGDVVETVGEITPPISRNQEPVSFFPKVKVTAEHHGSPLKEKLLTLKESFISQFKKFLPSDSAALLSGLTLGWRGDFTDEFKKEMSASGTTHLVALSGYNITILVLVVAGAFSYLLSRRLTFLLTTAVIFLFIIMVGAEASVLRAALMGFLVLLAKEAGRLRNIKNAVALTAAAMVFVNPPTLFDLGFQLSFLSLIGIVYLRPALVALFRVKEDSKSFLSWRENALTTLSAQLAVAPILIQTFGNFSMTSIFANILILEFVPLTMLVGFLLGLFGWIFYYVGFVLSFAENILLKYELAVIKLFADWSIPVQSGTGSWILFSAYYLALIILVSYSYGRRKTK